MIIDKAQTTSKYISYYRLPDRVKRKFKIMINKNISTVNISPTDNIKCLDVVRLKYIVN